MFLYLSAAGKSARDECVDKLNAFQRAIESCQTALAMEKGIGTEFLSEKLEQLKQDADELRRKVANMPT
mgnify:FL=1